MSAADIKPDGHRKDSRKPVSWLATLMLQDDRVFPCTVHDVSLAGTLVSSSAPVDIKDEILLTIEGIGEFAATVRWKCNENIGLVLLVGPDLLLKKFDADNPYQVPPKDPLL